MVRARAAAAAPVGGNFGSEWGLDLDWRLGLYTDCGLDWHFEVGA